MNFFRVTITGADDSIDPKLLAELSVIYPFVEWGILIGSSFGRPKFPSEKWLRSFVRVVRVQRFERRMLVATHLCSHWTRDLVNKAVFSFREDPVFCGTLYEISGRIQINGKGFDPHPRFHQRLLESAARQFILQDDGTTESLYTKMALKDHGPKITRLHDRSGGTGKLPDAWPEAKEGIVGYAGGLTPENLETEIPRIRKAAEDGYGVWVDVESGVRSADGEKFDIERVQKFLHKAACLGAKG